ncbi:MAG: thermonuclease family protein [Candidatus Hodarchaeales archaeon]|jgi:micrococcal nuclease
MYEYRAKLIRVIDGDTIDAMVDLGFDVWSKKRIRLYGINTPEVRTRDLEEKKAGIHAKERLQELLDGVNGSFILVSRGVGKYGRCLGELLIGEFGEIHINNLLLSEGLAEEYK